MPSLEVDRAPLFLASKPAEVALFKGGGSPLLAKLAVGPLEAGRLLGNGPLQKVDGLLVEATALPLGELLNTVFEIIGYALQGDSGHDWTAVLFGCKLVNKQRPPSAGFSRHVLAIPKTCYKFLLAGK
jgi:hypothetical protein